jgi:hypothetical protein
MALPYLIQGKNIVVVVNNTPHTISSTHIAYERIKQAIRDGDWNTVEEVVEPKAVLIGYGQGNVTIQGEQLLWKNTPMHTSLSQRVVSMYQEGFPIEPMINFMDNLMDNPSKRSVDQLYSFLEEGQLPITPDGHFLAYKKVGYDYMDVHSQTVLNKPAELLTQEELAFMPIAGGKQREVTIEVVDNVTVVSMARNGVDDNPNNTCSEGLHFCSREYLNHFGGERIVILKINPRDVVSIPVDYGYTKGRCSRYEVIGEIEGDVDQQTSMRMAVYVTTRDDDYDQDDYDQDDYDQDDYDQDDNESVVGTAGPQRDAYGRFVKKS